MALRVTDAGFSTELTELLKVCRRQVEYETYRKFITQTIKITQEYLRGNEIAIRLAPIQSVTSVKYYDEAGTLQTISADSYWVDSTTTPPRIVLNEDYDWPSDVDEDRPNAVEITVVCGYGSTAATVPPEVKLAIKELGKSRWHACEGDASNYERLRDMIAWTAIGAPL